MRAQALIRNVDVGLAIDGAFGGGVRRPLCRIASPAPHAYGPSSFVYCLSSVFIVVIVLTLGTQICCWRSAKSARSSGAAVLLFGDLQERDIGVPVDDCRSRFIEEVS